MSRSIFICPVCRKTLEKDRGSYRCGSGHCFDIAKEGYVNLLPANQRHSNMPGDDREMVNARTHFLDGGWYAPLRARLCELAGQYAGEKPVLLDAGCGEGYYTTGLCAVAAAKNGCTVGIDLSKAAVRKAAKRCTRAEIAVASVYHLPLAEKTVDLLIDCFSPLANEEFRRVLKPGGSFLYVVPGPQHLWELKKILYDQPYENPVREEEYAGFIQCEAVPLEFRFSLKNQEDIAALFHMTPYTWKTPKQGAERLEWLHALEVTAQFRILAFRRTERE